MTTSENGRKTSQSHWDNIWKSPFSKRLPSRLYVDIYNLTRLLEKHVKSGDRYCEIGCAPGKLLSWVAAKLHTETYGLDYSESGIQACHELFDALNLKAQFYQEDMFNNTLPVQSFDVVTSIGVIEHFDDPREAINKHIELLKTGGTALICIPNYSGIYLKLQKKFDIQNLNLHNLKIMSPEKLTELVAGDSRITAKAYPFGSFSLGLISLEKRLPKFIARAILYSTSLLALPQPFQIDSLSPMLVLEIKRK